MVNIDDSITTTIMHARKSLLFCEGTTWIKNPGAQFEVIMRLFHGPEICELVGLFLLYQLSSILNKDDVGPYRDNDLAVLRNSSGSDSDMMRKKMIQAFLQHDLKSNRRYQLDTN